MHCLGFDDAGAWSRPAPPGPLRERLFRILRIALGLIWLYHAWNTSSAAGNTALAGFLGLPVSSWVVHLAGTGVVPVDLYTAPVLRSGRGDAFHAVARRCLAARHVGSRRARRRNCRRGVERGPPNPPVMRRDVSRGAGVIEPPWDPEWHA